MKDTSVLPRIGALKEMNLEYFAIDNQGFITDHERAMEELFGENVESSRKYDACLNTMATRIATVFATLRVLNYCLMTFFELAHVTFSCLTLSVPYCETFFS